jgi:hypothetical protein
MDTMRENARKLGEIRKLCNKVALIRNMSQQIPGVLSPQTPLSDVSCSNLPPRPASNPSSTNSSGVSPSKAKTPPSSLRPQK